MVCIVYADFPSGEMCIRDRYLLLRKFLYKPVMGIIEKRDEMIKTQLETAKKTEQDAIDVYKRQVLYFAESK